VEEGNIGRSYPCRNFFECEGILGWNGRRKCGIHSFRRVNNRKWQKIVGYICERNVPKREKVPPHPMSK
jgi:hypothetical protein